MDEPEKQDQGKESFINRIKEKAKGARGVNGIWDHRTEIFSGILVFVGLVLAFFYVHLGGLLVGLGVGLCFFDELYHWASQLKGYYTAQGLLKTLIGIATALYLLIAIPAFVIAAAVGFGAMFLIHRLVDTSTKK